MKLWREYVARRDKRRQLMTEIENLGGEIIKYLNDQSIFYLGGNRTTADRLKLEATLNSTIDQFHAVVDQWNFFDYVLDGDEIRQQLKSVTWTWRKIHSRPDRQMY
ncbi:hypothetical protein D9M68_18160 [compost metagenome]